MTESDRPIIGITMTTMTGEGEWGPVRYHLRRDYVDRIREAGGATVLIPPGTDAAAIAPILDGWLIPGGDDLPGELFGEPTHPEAGLENPDRIRLEQEIYQAIPPELPILGICYGCQILNVFEGGTLHQHLPDVLGDDRHRGDAWQEYQIEPESRLGRIVEGRAAGKSWHHQAVARPAPGLRVVARHPDGTIEGLESEGRPWMIGVQWHPERSDDPATAKLFAAFIQAAREHRRRRTRQ
ncbi:MAG: gamma-glutamyl-gamma-aminobutyrate hydrolase family protein [Fimbriimonadaceae bacterium]|nr:gamma-glutamyl-gamma-aminobutyrate hydrolase family protein [Fimbriimonadaceae bacterium]